MADDFEVIDFGRPTTTKKSAATARKHAQTRAARAPVEPEPEAPPPPVEEVPDPPHPSELSEEEAENVGFTVVDAAYEAYKLKVAGYRWADIATRLKYEEPGHAQAAVETYMRRAVAELGPASRSMALRLSVDRHEALIASWWDSATKGQNANAAAVVSRELGQLDKVLRTGEMDTQAGQGGPRIVIAGSEEDYVRSLQDVYGHQAAALPPARGETVEQESEPA